MIINLSSVFNFIIILVELCFIGALIYAAIEFIATDERFKYIAKIAVAGVLVVLFLFAVKAVFSGGGGGMNLTPLGFLYFAIGVILVLVVWFIIDKVLAYAPGLFPDRMLAPLGAVMSIVQFVLAAIVLVVILLIAANVLFGAGVGTSNLPFRFSDSAMPRLADWQPTRAVREL